MVSVLYKIRLIRWLWAYEPSGASAEDIRQRFPRAPIREMEKTDGTIEYRDGFWHVSEVGRIHVPAIKE